MTMHNISAAQEAQPDQVFTEFRRKVKQAEVLSGSMERLLMTLNFTGKITMTIQNGRILKSGYEEGYFRNKQ